MDEKKDYVIEEDEINLIDLLKIIYKWRVVVIVSIVLIELIFLGYVYFSKPKYQAKSILKIGTFDGKILENDTMINSYLHNKFLVNKVINLIGEDELLKLLNIKKENYFKLEGLNKKRLILSKWNKSVTFSQESLITTFYSPDNNAEINIFLAKYIKEHHAVILEKNKNNYIELLNVMLKSIVNKNRNSIYIGSINIPSFTTTEIILKATDDTIQVIKPSLKKYLLIGLFIGLFIGLILPFILEFFSKIEWKEIKDQE